MTTRDSTHLHTDAILCTSARNQALAVAMLILLFSASCYLPSPVPTHSAVSLAAVTPEVEPLPKGMYLFVEWHIEMSEADAKACGLGWGEATKAVYRVDKDLHAWVRLGKPLPESAIGFAGTSEHVRDLGGHGVDVILSVPFSLARGVQILRINADGSIVAGINGKLWKVDPGGSWRDVSLDTWGQCTANLDHELINHGLLDANDITFEFK